MFYNYEPKFVKIEKRYLSGRIIPSLPIIIENEEAAIESIFDPRLTTHHGWVPIPAGLINTLKKKALFGNKDISVEDIPSSLISKENQGILLPIGINKITTVVNGFGYMNDVQKAAYRIISHISSIEYLKTIDNSTYAIQQEYNRLQWALDQYTAIIAGKLSGKRGLIRKAAYPRQNLSGFSVMTSRIGRLNEVHVPIRILKRWLQNDRYAEKVGIKEMPSTLSEWKSAFRHQNALLIGMPDHDEKCMFCLRIIPWKDSTIAVHPIVAMTMGRDFDGDLIYLKAFINKQADKELNRFTIQGQLENIKNSMTKIYAIIDKSTIKTEEDLLAAVKKVHSVRRFTSTSLKDAAILEYASPNKATLFNKLHNGLNKTEIIHMANMSAIDFSIVKCGTANGGDMGNIIRVLASKLGPRAVIDANHFYHLCAQAALSAKHGTTDLTEKIAELLRRKMPKTSNEFVTKIKVLVNDPAIVKMLTLIFYNKNKCRGRLEEILNKQSKYGSVIRGNSLSLYQPIPNIDMISNFLEKRY